MKKGMKKLVAAGVNGDVSGFVVFRRVFGCIMLMHNQYNNPQQMPLPSASEGR